MAEPTPDRGGTEPPTDPAALLHAGREALRAGEPVRAEALLRAAVAAAPGLEEAWHRLGGARLRQVGLAAAAREIAAESQRASTPAAARIAARMLAQSGQREAAIERARAALACDPRDPASATLLAGLLRSAGALDEARTVVAAALADRADSPKLLLEAAQVALHDDPPRALDLATRVLALDPGNAAAERLVGKSLGRIDDLSQREARLRERIATDPDSASARLELARTLAAQKRFAEAAALLPPILRGRPDDGHAHMFASMVLSNLGASKRALTLARRGVALLPDSGPAHCALATILNRLARYREAERHAREATRLAPDMVEGHNLLSLALLRQGRLAESEAASLAALSRDPDSADVVGHLATLQMALERHEEALANFSRALALRPDDAEVRFNRSLIHFARGDFEAAWEDFAWRWKMGSAKRRPFRQPWWDGRATDAPVLVWGEQGIGDEILAASAFADARARTGGLVIESDNRLVPLFRRSFPDASVVGRADPPDPATELAAIQAPAVDLLFHLRRGWDDFPDHRGYLVPDPQRTAGLRARYRSGGAQRVVGISWSSANPRMGERKSLALAAWAPILRAPGCVFVNLQYGDTAAEWQAVQDAGAAAIHDAEIDAMADLDGFAAQVAAMDLVITVSNSTAHFAGATGRPTWLLLPRGNGVLWYWMLSRDGRVPWYPSMRAYPQHEIGEWS
ncbi:MAG: tetratricopeptide repeat protein, partial [Alphaproteobacteria bacterium]